MKTALKGLKAVLVFANKARRHPGVFSTTAFVFHSLGSPNHFFVSAGSVSEVAILAGLPEDEILPFNQSLDFPEKFNYHPDLRRGSLIGVACERVTPELTWHYHGVGVIAEVGATGTDWTQLTVYVVPKLHGRHKQPLTFFRPSRERIQALHPDGQLEDLDNDRFRIHTLDFSREFCRGLEVMKVNINQTFVPTENPTEFEMDAFRAAFQDSPLLDLCNLIGHAVYRLDRACFPEGEYLKVVAGDYAGHAVLPVLEEHKPANIPLRPNHVLVALGKYNGTGCLIIPLPIPYLRRHITVMDKVVFRTHLGESCGWVESIDSCTGDFKVRESDSVSYFLHNCRHLAYILDGRVLTFGSTPTRYSMPPPFFFTTASSMTSLPNSYKNRP
jgi:hypothetical protein